MAQSTYAGLEFRAWDFTSWSTTMNIYQTTSINASTGVLEMNSYAVQTVGRALYKDPVHLFNSSANLLASFNTSFAFSMNTVRSPEFFGDGMTFLICPRAFFDNTVQISAGGYLGMFNRTTNGRLYNRVVAVEFDTHRNPPFNDPNDNHVGIDINSLTSVKLNDLSKTSIVLNDGSRYWCWLDYDGVGKTLWVYLSRRSSKPARALITLDLDLSVYIRDYMYIGFTSSTGSRAELHTIYSWYFSSVFIPMPAYSPAEAPSPIPPPDYRRRNAIIAAMTLLAFLLLLCILFLLARWTWRKQTKDWTSIFLPVACWMYWKESTSEPSQYRSGNCLNLAVPSVELIAWLWRTNLAKKRKAYCRERLCLHLRRPLLLKSPLKRKALSNKHKGQAWSEEHGKKPFQQGKSKNKAQAATIELIEIEDAGGDGGLISKEANQGHQIVIQPSSDHRDNKHLFLNNVRLSLRGHAPFLPVQKRNKDATSPLPSAAGLARNVYKGGEPPPTMQVPVKEKTDIPLPSAAGLARAVFTEEPSSPKIRTTPREEKPIAEKIAVPVPTAAGLARALLKGNSPARTVYTSPRKQQPLRRASANSEWSPRAKVKVISELQGSSTGGSEEVRTKPTSEDRGEEGASPKFPEVMITEAGMEANQGPNSGILAEGQPSSANLASMEGFSSQMMTETNDSQQRAASMEGIPSQAIIIDDAPHHRPTGLADASADHGPLVDIARSDFPTPQSSLEPYSNNEDSPPPAQPAVPPYADPSPLQEGSGQSHMWLFDSS